jgi:hypothetical protein
MLRIRTAALLILALAIVVVTAQAGLAASRPGTVATVAGITAEADYLSGRSLTVVCASSSLEWRQALTANGLAAADADEYYGFSLIPQGEMYLSPYVCEGLQLGAGSIRPADELQVAWSVDVLIHESTHLGRFTYNEALAEACARAGLPAELHRLYQVAYHSPQLRRLTLDAAAFRNTQGAVYRGGTCT